MILNSEPFVKCLCSHKMGFCRASYPLQIDENEKAVSAAQAAQDVRSEAMGYRERAQALGGRGNREERLRHLERALALTRDAGLRLVRQDNQDKLHLYSLKR